MDANRKTGGMGSNRAVDCRSKVEPELASIYIDSQRAGITLDSHRIHTRRVVTPNR